jgi:tetratricopeptide (TPR) repeat protein
MILVIVVLSVTAYARNGVWRDEVTLWEDVVKKSPQAYRANFNLGLFHAKSGRFDEAIREFQSAIMINRNYPEVYNNLGLAYLHKGNMDAALRNLQTALKLEPQAGYIYESLGQVYAARGRNEEAMRCLQKALELDPNDAEARKNLDNLQKLTKNKTKE